MESKPSIDKNEYLTIHLPYSLRILMAHARITQEAYDKDPDILNAVFVGSLVKGRMLLEVMGIKPSREGRGLTFPQKKKEYSDDVSIEDLGGKFIAADELNPYDKNMLVNFLTAANKYEAHLTAQKLPVDHERIRPAYDLILNLVKERIYDVNNIPFPFVPVHPIDQFTN